VNRRVILVAVAACALVTGAWYTFLWSPQSDQIASTKKQLDATQQQQKDLNVQLRGLEAAKKKLPEIKAQLDTLRAALPPAPQLDNAIATVQDAAKGSGVDLTALTPAPLPAPGTTATGPKAAVPEIKVTMTVAGSYFQIMDFVNRLNTEARLVVVDNVSLSGQIDQAKNTKVMTQLTGRLFFAPEGTK
jgi:Tfp pilus assembly protein PilO